MWSCFACERSFSQRVCHIQIRMYFVNFYVYNALHRATLANCSHFQYVSRWRLRVIWISVKTCIDVTLYDEPFCHLHNLETYLRESWIRGYPDSRTISFGRTVGLWRYKIEDFVPCPDGTPWRGRQAWQYGYVDLLPCNRLCVTLAPSGVYINRRV